MYLHLTSERIPCRTFCLPIFLFSLRSRGVIVSLKLMRRDTTTSDREALRQRGGAMQREHTVGCPKGVSTSFAELRTENTLSLGVRVCLRLLAT